MSQRFQVFPHQPHPRGSVAWVLYDLQHPVKVNGRTTVQLATFLDEFPAAIVCGLLNLNADAFDKGMASLGAGEPF